MERASMRRRLVGSVAVILSFAASASVWAGDAVGPKIIEWGWGTPTPSYIRDHVREMEQLPFDGLGLDLKANAGPSDTRGFFSWNVWAPTNLRADDYSESVEALKNTVFRRFTDNFLRFNVTPGQIDWYDERFDSVIANARLAARLARECRLKGVLFDVEHYQGRPFSYSAQSGKAAHRFVEYQQQVRHRGREFMRALNAEYPDITIILTYGYHLAYQAVSLIATLQSAEYGLLPAFLDGMLEAAAPNSLIFDGWESSYGYKKEDQFEKARDLMLTKGLERTGTKEQFRRHYRASFGLWLDYGGMVWNQREFSKNYFTPEEFEHSLRIALKHTDRYVWIYSHHARWWDGQVPQPYFEALTRARAMHASLPTTAR